VTEVVEVEVAIGNLNSYKSADTDHIPSELIKGEHELLLSELSNLIHSVWNK